MPTRRIPQAARDYLASIGRKGGQAKSAKKTAAVRKNGKKGGNPAAFK